MTSKPCKHCGKELLRKRYNGTLEDRGRFRHRIYCDIQCFGADQAGIRVHTPSNSRYHASRLAEPSCEHCGRPRTSTRMYVHHKDDDPLNNTPDNLITLCGSCHRRWHSSGYTDNGTKKKPCELCTNPSYRGGLCSTHLTRRKKYGDPLLTKVFQDHRWVLVRDNLEP